MSGNIEQDTSPKERRLKPRFQAREQALVVATGDDLSIPYTLIDISENGMAFRYLNESPLPLRGSQMDIYINEELYVGRLPVMVVLDRQLSSTLMPMRRCSVCFAKLTNAQKVQLKAFIQSQTRSASPHS